LEQNKNAWKKVARKNEEPHIKTISGTTFNLCMHHKAWYIHKPGECYLRLPAANVAANTSNGVG